MLDLMLEQPEIKDLNPKYGSLEEDLKNEIQLWNEAGHQG